MRRFPLSRLPLVLSLALLLAACGNKGPLVLPTPADEVEEIDEVEDVEDVEDVDVIEDVETDDGERTEAVEEVIEQTTEDPLHDGDPVEVPPPADPGNG